MQVCTVRIPGVLVGATSMCVYVINSDEIEHRLNMIIADHYSCVDIRFDCHVLLDPAVYGSQSGTRAPEAVAQTLRYQGSR